MGGRPWGLSNPSRLLTGQQLVHVAWLEKLTSGRREAADLLGGRIPTQKIWWSSNSKRSTGRKEGEHTLPARPQILPSAHLRG